MRGNTLFRVIAFATRIDKRKEKRLDSSVKVNRFSVFIPFRHPQTNSLKIEQFTSI